MLSIFKGVFFDAGDTLITADPPVKEVALTVASHFFPRPCASAVSISSGSRQSFLQSILRQLLFSGGGLSAG
jgi:FMN phosphatase YigB (HAD superfamily)